jgi:hypothetical protein
MSDTPTIEDLMAEIAELRARLDAPPPLPSIEPHWDVRTCQICSAPAEVIDADDTLRRTVGGGWINGEGYCRTHVPAEVMAEGHERLER